MKIFYSPRFATEYEKLPKKVKLLAEKKEEIFRNYPYDLRLKTHRLSVVLIKLWAFSIGYGYEIIFEFKDRDSIKFHTVGIYDI